MNVIFAAGNNQLISYRCFFINIMVTVITVLIKTTVLSLRKFVVSAESTVLLYSVNV